MSRLNLFRKHLLKRICASAFPSILLMSGLVLARSNSQGDVINLTGIAGSYSFERFCRPDPDGLWAVGGNGTVQYTDKSGMRERQITEKSLNGIYFADSFAGWVVGDAGTILRTTDGGASWKVQKSTVAEDLYGLTCHDENRCWVVGKNGVILRTVGKGNHWKLLRSGTSVNLFALSFANDRSGWAVGDDGFLVHTSDGGDNRVGQRAIIILFPDGPFATPTDLLAVKFLDEKRGWVAGAGGIARTVDGVRIGK